MNWNQSLRAFLHPRVITMLFYGFSAGLPLMLIFSSLSLWLREAGIERSVVTLFSWAALGYSFKFVWAPIVDTLNVPILTRLLGRRRSWILVAQVMVMISISLMAIQNPAADDHYLVYMAVAAVLLGFSSATQDIVIDAYRIESAGTELQALMSSSYIAGYRIGMLVSGAGALYLASYFGTTSEQYVYVAWRHTYLIMAAFMGVGMITTMMIAEPKRIASSDAKDIEVKHGQTLVMFVLAVISFIFMYRISADLAILLKTNFTEFLNNKAISGIVVESLRLCCAAGFVVLMITLLSSLKVIRPDDAKMLYLNPVKEFFSRYRLSLTILILALIGLYRISDIVLGVISNVFYQDIGFSKNEIATVSKFFGLVMTLVGGFLGGMLAIRYGVIRVLLIGAILSALTNLLFLLLANSGYNMGILYMVIGADNLSAGIATASFVAFLSALTNIKFTAMQYSIFTSIMTLLPKMLGGYSGSMVDSLGYPTFFIVTTVIGIPVIVLILLVAKNKDFK